MPTPWRRGYEWMQGKGRHKGKTCANATKAFGYAPDSPEADQFLAGTEAYVTDFENEREGFV